MNDKYNWCEDWNFIKKDWNTANLTEKMYGEKLHYLIHGM